MSTLSSTINPPDSLRATTTPVGQIITDRRLHLPDYQRPYRWGPRQITQLVNDVLQFQTAQVYRLGSLVLHEETDRLNVVDGQQRLTTLSLLLRVLFDRFRTTKNIKLTKAIRELQPQLFNPNFRHADSRRNVQTNYALLQQITISLTEAHTLFLLERCEFVRFTLYNIDLAFQFFDSQNARGRPLAPHDLLKAYHLRAFSEREQASEEQLIENWEQTPSRDLVHLFDHYLYRIRNWSQGRSARKFTRAHVEQFKGLHPEQNQDVPFLQVYRRAQLATDQYNNFPYRSLGGDPLPYPFQLDMPILNGALFFEMVTHYHERRNRLFTGVQSALQKSTTAYQTMEFIKLYPYRRVGDRYIEQLFRAALLFYVDRFGYSDINTAVRHLFVWCYRLRLEFKSVQFARIDNHACDSFGYFRRMASAVRPRQVWQDGFDVNIKVRYEKASEVEDFLRKHGVSLT